MGKKIEVDEDEYNWLLWFKQNADFGPADSDVQDAMRRRYKAQGGTIPPGWDCCSDCGCCLDDCDCEEPS